MALFKNINLLFAPSAKGQTPVKHLKPVRKSYGVQGGCCSDSYVYELMNGKYYSIIHKIDPISWKTVQSSAHIQVGHGNDMCWNSKTNELIVVHNTPEMNVVSIFDADTLEFKQKRTIGVNIYAIDYDRENGIYYVCEVGGRRYAKLDSDFRILRFYRLDVKGHVRQGMMYRDGRLYMVLFRRNVIKIFTENGRHLRTFSLPVKNGEPENMFVFDNTFYISYNKKKYYGALIYRLDALKWGYRI